MADFGLSTILTIASTAVAAVGTIAGGAAAKQSSDFTAAQLEQAGKEEKAAAQREAQQARRERDFVMSRQQAVAGASNLGALDETVLDLAGDVTQQGALNEAMIQYGGEERAKGRRQQAAAARLEGKAAMTGALLKAGGTILGGIGDFAAEYPGVKRDPWAGKRNVTSQYGYA